MDEGRSLSLAARVLRRLRALAVPWRFAFTRAPVIRQLRGMRWRRLHPLSEGRQRGTAIVRHYWASFLEMHRRDIRGAALEIGDTVTIRRYGGDSLTSAEAIDVSAHSPEVKVVADLARADAVPSNGYDCFVNQFTMHVIYDSEAALYHSIRILKPGGVLLINFPCVEYYFADGLDMGTGTPLLMYWWFTPLHVEELLRRVGLSAADYTISVFGNLFSRLAYQMNVPAEELTSAELAYRDPGHPLLVCVRVVKPEVWRTQKPAYRDPVIRPVHPARWSAERGHYGTEE